MTPEEEASLGDLNERFKRVSVPIVRRLIAVVGEISQEARDGRSEAGPYDTQRALSMALASHALATIEDDAWDQPHVAAAALAQGVASDFLKIHRVAMLQRAAANQPAG